MSRFNTSTSHPLIPNAQQYMFEKQYVSIHSEDRNMLRYPNASEFEIELPQDYLNVQGIKLITSRFPTNLDLFCALQRNISMTFTITDPYIGPSPTSLEDAVYLALYNNESTGYLVTIEEGNYTPQQIATELTNKFNLAVTNVVTSSSSLTSVQKTAFLAAGGYTKFIIVYNEVSKKLWFGNESDGFTITNSTLYLKQNSSYLYGQSCVVNNNGKQCATDVKKVISQDQGMLCGQNALPQFSSWGLPYYLGLPICDVAAVVDVSANTLNSATRFFYTDVSGGVWLTPSPATAHCYYLESTYQVNLTTPLYMYMEIKLLNFMDETSPYNFSTFTMQTNQTNGVVKSAFAKIPIISEGENHWYEQSDTFKIYNPPAERIRKLCIKLRYHDGTLVDFGNSEYSFMLEFTLFRPQNAKTYMMYTPESIAYSNAS